MSKKSIFEVIAIWRSKFQRKSTSTGRRSFSACPRGNFSVPPWHSLENYDHSVIKIINGFHTGRTEGAPITDLALSMLERINGKDGAGSISYYTKNKKGEPLQSRRR